MGSLPRVRLSTGGGVIIDGSFKVSNELLKVENYGTVVATGTDIWTGDVEIQGYTNLFVDREHSLRIDGKLSSKDYQNIAATGQGLLELAGASTFNGGGFYVYYGTLQVDKTLTGLDALYAYYGATLQGAGTIGAAYIQGYDAEFRNSGSVNTSLFDVSYGSTIDPAGNNKTATLKTGNIALISSTLEVQLNGASSYDQLNVIGTVALYGAVLHVSLGFTPKVGQQFMLIKNDGTDAVDGTFNGYAEGDLVQSGDLAFRISYVGGTGNDVVLTRFSGTAVKEGVLYYFGTDDADSFDVKLLENAGVFEVTTKSGMNGRSTVQQFNVADLSLIRVYLGGGNDHACIDKNVQLDAIVDGGSGNDILYAGGGNSQLFGGNGNDWLIGGSGNNLLLGGDGIDILLAGDGRDVLIGGGGNDILRGGMQDDLLVGGTTSYDQNSFALEAILAEWTSDHSYEDRVANILGICTGYPFYDRLNGDFFLNATTVFDDDSSDILQGNAGRDFYFARIGRHGHSDWTDRKSEESIVEL